MSPIRRWWSEHYGRPLNDPLFQNQTESELLLDFFRDLHERRDRLEMRLKDAPGEERLRIRQAIDSIDSLLSEDVTDDDLMGRTGDRQIDQWLDTLDDGNIPDLNAGIPASLLKTNG
jgi:hypothetical protein